MKVNNVAISPKAILFDLDGTLIDSTSAIEKSWTMWAIKNKLNVEELLSQIHGVSGLDIIPKFAPWLDPISETSKLLDVENELISESLLIPGAYDFLYSFNNYKWGIVTSSSKKSTLAKLRMHKLPIPEVLITSEDVVNKKPNPEPFLLAAKKLKILPEECLVFEDSVSGIKSAQAAGMLVIQVTYAGHTPTQESVWESINNYKKIEYQSKAIYAS